MRKRPAASVTAPLPAWSWIATCAPEIGRAPVCVTTVPAMTPSCACALRGKAMSAAARAIAPARAHVARHATPRRGLERLQTTVDMMVCLYREVSLVRQEGRENGRRSARGDPNEVAQ